MFCYQLITKLLIYKALFLKSKHKKLRDLIFASSEKSSFKCAHDGVLFNNLGMTLTVLLRLKSEQLIENFVIVMIKYV